jgi:hypothetical protein
VLASGHLPAEPIQQTAAPYGHSTVRCEHLEEAKVPRVERDRSGAVPHDEHAAKIVTEGDRGRDGVAESSLGQRRADLGPRVFQRRQHPCSAGLHQTYQTARLWSAGSYQAVVVVEVIAQTAIPVWQYQFGCPGPHDLTGVAEDRH